MSIPSIRAIAGRLKEALSAEDSAHLYTLPVIILLGIAVRLDFLFQPIRYDEAFSFTNYASKPLLFGLSDYSYPNNHLFHTLLVHLFCSAFGNQPWVIRLPALIAGVLSIPASYFAIRAFYNKISTIMAAGLVAPSSPLIEYSTNGRGYTIICLIFLLTLTLAASLTQKENPARWILFSFLSAIGFYTIPIMLYPFGATVIWLLLSIVIGDSKFERTVLLQRLFIALVMVALLTFIFYAPVLAVSGLDSIVSNRFVKPKPWADFITQLPPSLVSVWNQWNRDIPRPVSLLLLAGFLVSLVFHKRLTRYDVPILAGVAVCLVPVLAIQRVIPFVRVWLFLYPLYAGVASSGVSFLFGAERAATLAKSAIFPVLSLSLSIWLSFNVIRSQSVYFSNETGTLRDAERITLFLKGYLTAGDKVLTAAPSDAILIYYFDLYGISREYLTSHSGARGRIFIIVNDDTHQTLKGFMRFIRRPAVQFVPVRVLRRYESATIYEIDKI